MLAACSPAGPPPTSTSAAQLTTGSILAAINGVRKANGRKALTYNHRLEQAARNHAQMMASRNQVSHTLGGSLRQRVAAVGYEGAVGENIATGQLTLEEAIQGWLDSGSHRNVLLSDRFTEFGLAAVNANNAGKRRTYWVFITGGSVAAWIGTPS